MKNISEIIIPLTKDELGKFKGGFGKINITNKTEDIEEGNKNCYGSILTRSKLESGLNTNCHNSCICSQ